MLEALPGGHSARDVRLSRQPRGGAPREFVEYAVVPQLPLELPPDEIEANRDRWVREWTDIVVLEGSDPCPTLEVWRTATYTIPLAFSRSSSRIPCFRSWNAAFERTARFSARCPHGPDARRRLVHVCRQRRPPDSGRIGAHVLGRFAFRGGRRRRALVVVLRPRRSWRSRSSRAAGRARARMDRDPHRARFNVAVVALVSTFWASLDRRTSEVAATPECPRATSARSPSPARFIAARLDRLPLLHVVRGRADSRRPGLFDDRGRDLQPGCPHLRPARGRDPLRRPADLRRCGRITLKLEAFAAVGAGPRSERDVLRKPRTSRDGASSAEAWACSRCFSAYRSRWSAPLPSATDTASTRTAPRPPHLGTPRHTVGSGLELAPVRSRCDGHRGRHRRSRRLCGREQHRATRARRPAHAPARRLGRDARFGFADRVRSSADRLPRGSVDRSGRPGARRASSSSGSWRPHCERSTPARGRRDARRLADGCAARSTCPSWVGRWRWPPVSRSPSRSSSARPSFWLARTPRRYPSRSFASSDGPGRSTLHRRTRSPSCSWH